MPSGTTYNPPNVLAFVKSALLFDAQGKSGTIPAGTSASIDCALTDDCLLTGIALVSNNGAYGDSANLQIVDSTGAFTGTPGTVMNQFVTGWNMPPNADEEFRMTYPAKILAGMTIRIVYTSTGTSNVFVGINYELHKVLL